MNLTFLFWNLHGRSKDHAARAPALRRCLARLARLHQVDVFLLAECAIPEADLVASLSEAETGTFALVPSTRTRIHCFSRLQEANWSERLKDPQSDRHTIQSLQVGKSKSILVVGTHCDSRIDVPTEGGRAERAQDLAADIRLVEDEVVGHNRTVVVGDFNMNPFEQGMVGARALHALPTRQLARTISRLGKRARYRCFYNPMWAVFGDRSSGPPGTYFFSNSVDPTNHFWNVYDQVLLRPEIMDNRTALDVLDTDGQEPLVSKEGRPRKATLTDHLPLRFTLNI